MRVPVYQPLPRQGGRLDDPREPKVRSRKATSVKGSKRPSRSAYSAPQVGLLAQSKSEKAPKKLKSRVGLAGSPPGGEPAANLATDSPRPRNAGGGAADGACSASPASEDDDDFAFDAPAPAPRPAPVDGASDSGAHAPIRP